MPTSVAPGSSVGPATSVATPIPGSVISSNLAGESYRYRDRDDNQIYPIATAVAWPRSESYSLTWYRRFLPGFFRAGSNLIRTWIDEKLQKLVFRFDLLLAYKRLFPEGRAGRPLPTFVRDADSDEAFACRRVAGPNPLSLTRANDLSDVLGRMPEFCVARVLASLGASPRYVAPPSLAQSAALGRLFFVDFRGMSSAIPVRTIRPGGWKGDTRWRSKYFATPVAVFLEVDRKEGGRCLIPLAIQIEPGRPVDYPPPDPRPDQGWAWRIAKHYFETADVSYHESIGHAYHSHLILEPFAMATPRRLDRNHPVRLLLEPHLRFTLKANRDAYKYLTDRTKTYAWFYSGTLECQRNLMTEAYRLQTFGDLGLEADLAARGVDQAPLDYPYRDDARLWWTALHGFMVKYVDEFYRSDLDVENDALLQVWLAELLDPKCGSMIGVVPNGTLETKPKLTNLLTQVLFIAGPGHAAQHYSSAHFYRYSPAFPAAAWFPPPDSRGRVRNEHRASYDAALPPIGAARMQFTYNTFLDFRYDRFGDYRDYPLGRNPRAAAAIETLKQSLASIEQAIAARQASRSDTYDFLLPSKVPNSVTI